jgi:hypothetical protein
MGIPQFDGLILGSTQEVLSLRWEWQQHEKNEKSERQRHEREPKIPFRVTTKTALVWSSSETTSSVGSDIHET